MKVLKIAIVLASTALMTSPAWALPAGSPGTTAKRSLEGQENENAGKHRGPHNRSDQGDRGDRHHHTGRHRGHSHRCAPHNVAYLAAGTLLSQTLAKDASANTYSGELEVAVKRTNRHAAPDRNTTKTYKVEHVRVTFALADVNHDGSVGLDDVQPNDRVRLIGKISSLAKKCDRSGFTPTLAIRHIVLHPPADS